MSILLKDRDEVAPTGPRADEGQGLDGRYGFAHAQLLFIGAFHPRSRRSLSIRWRAWKGMQLTGRNVKEGITACGHCQGNLMLERLLYALKVNWKHRDA